MEYTLTIPPEDIEEAKRQGYSVIRPMVVLSGDGTIGRQWTQVRTGFWADTGTEIWKDLYPAKTEDE